MRIAAGENELARHLPIPRNLSRGILWLQRHRLPARTNLPLAVALQSAARSRIPILVVTAEGLMRELFFNRVIHIVVPDYAQLSSPLGAIKHVQIAGTNHTFTTGWAIEQVTTTVREWVKDVFELRN